MRCRVARLAAGWYLQLQGGIYGCLVAGLRGARLWCAYLLTTCILLSMHHHLVTCRSCWTTWLVGATPCWGGGAVLPGGEGASLAPAAATHLCSPTDAAATDLIGPPPPPVHRVQVWTQPCWLHPACLHLVPGPGGPRVTWCRLARWCPGRVVPAGKPRAFQGRKKGSLCWGRHLLMLHPASRPSPSAHWQPSLPPCPPPH